MMISTFNYLQGIKGDFVDKQVLADNLTMNEVNVVGEDLTYLVMRLYQFFHDPAKLPYKEIFNILNREKSEGLVIEDDDDG